MDGSLADLISRDVLVISLECFLGRTDFNLHENVEVMKATSNVEGFLSTVIRVKTSYNIEGEEVVNRKSLIFKMLPKESLSLENFNVREAFFKEAIFFEKALPLIKESSAGNIKLPFPECYYVKYEGVNQAIVMEDLAQEGFQTPDRRFLSQGLDLAHCKLTMTCLGKLHGHLIAAEKSLPHGVGTWVDALPPLVKEGLFYVAGDGELEAPAFGIVENGMKMVLELSDDIEGIPQQAKASGMLDKISKVLWSHVCKSVESDPEGPNVLSHGDFWTFNLMFKYADDGCGKQVPVDVKTIDFQLTRYCHPCLDIVFILYSCTKKSLRDAHLESLLSTYHESLEETLKNLGAGPLISFEKLRKDLWDRYRPFAVSTGVCFAPLILLGDDFLPPNADDVTREKLEEILTTGNIAKVKEKFASDDTYKSEVEALIKEFIESRGVEVSTSALISDSSKRKPA
ncbi:hypothetical protein J437_LFUL016065 [Ladona fulva]|uniref:CHK kinase-like domain-containing protein n=1 Tax=Ladona fulva TaxID=123851 RepID=A0A8K0P546_LADFU|nr:hypothetical protein J437_LFUL016065 [Ladona fulva]